ncbi:MAG: DNA polymerase domain-containing protein [Kiritimatiellae bacterium]|nr:DNA polymerase domain-containing protein [Kiritimatiellia bacterium]
MKSSNRAQEPAFDENIILNGRAIDDSLLFGQKGEKGLVAVEIAEGKNSRDEVVLFFRQGEQIVEKRELFQPFIVADGKVLKDCPVEFKPKHLTGPGNLNLCALFSSWKDCLQTCKWLGEKTGLTTNAPNAPFMFFNDPVLQHMILAGRTMFRGMQFDDLRRVQLDIECVTSQGYEFCNAEREKDEIIAIALGDQSGWTEVIAGPDIDEKTILKKFVELLREKNPDVIEGHNIFNFDLPYIMERAKKHGVKLSLGRDGSLPRHRPSRFSVAERTISYDRFDIFGRHIVDTLFLVQAYDVSHRELSGYGLKDVALHFGLANKDRTYIEGSQITAEYLHNPNRVIKYVQDDIIETCNLSTLLSKSNFIQAQILPYSYQNVCVRGNATKIDALMVREYLRQMHSIPIPNLPREFEGGYTDIFVHGVVENVHHCDIRSLYPSLMLSRSLSPSNDELGVFLRLLDLLRTFRIQAKQKMQSCSSKSEKLYLDALQAAFKILINSFYGYLGFSQGHFSDYNIAGQVTEYGRSLLKTMIQWLNEHGARPIEIDTDGIYFVPPSGLTEKKLESFRKDFSKILPDGIEVEFDDKYLSMYSYKMKNYALLTYGKELIIKGAALKSRGLEPFQRYFMREMLRLKLERRDNEIPKLKKRYEQEIRERKWPVERFAKTENLQDAPATYASKRSAGKRSRSAVYELVLRSGRDYRAGDQVSYYVTGDKKSMVVHENAKLVSEWNPAQRDENIAYYVDKLDSLYKKFCDDSLQAEMDL